MVRGVGGRGAGRGQDVPYLLLVRPTRPTDGGFEVVDPVEGNRRVFSGPDYEALRMWLLEDEFVCVGRKELDEE